MNSNTNKDAIFSNNFNYKLANKIVIDTKFNQAHIDAFLIYLGFIKIVIPSEGANVISNIPIVVDCDLAISLMKSLIFGDDWVESQFIISYLYICEFFYELSKKSPVRFHARPSVGIPNKISEFPYYPLDINFTYCRLTTQLKNYLRYITSGASCKNYEFCDDKPYLVSSKDIEDRSFMIPEGDLKKLIRDGFSFTEGGDTFKLLRVGQRFMHVTTIDANSKEKYYYKGHHLCCVKVIKAVEGYWLGMGRKKIKGGKGKEAVKNIILDTPGRSYDTIVNGHIELKFNYSGTDFFNKAITNLECGRFKPILIYYTEFSKNPVEHEKCLDQYILNNLRSILPYDCGSGLFYHNIDDEEFAVTNGYLNSALIRWVCIASGFTIHFDKEGSSYPDNCLWLLNMHAYGRGYGNIYYLIICQYNDYMQSLTKAETANGTPAIVLSCSVSGNINHPVAKTAITTTTLEFRVLSTLLPNNPEAKSSNPTPTFELMVSKGSKLNYPEAKASIPLLLHHHLIRDNPPSIIVQREYKKILVGKHRVVKKKKRSKARVRRRRKDKLKKHKIVSLAPWLCCSSVGFYNRTAVGQKKTTAVLCACNTGHPVAGLVYWMAGVCGALKPQIFRHTSFIIILDLPLGSLTIMWRQLFFISDIPPLPNFIFILPGLNSLLFNLIFNLSFYFIFTFGGVATPKSTTKLMVITTSKGSSARDSRKGPTGGCLT
jgi:hypothetical protein